MMFTNYQQSKYVSDLNNAQTEHNYYVSINTILYLLFFV